MNNMFSGKEIIEIGIQIEKNGRDFYSFLLKSFTDIKLQELFKFLAAEESRHIEVFKRILEEDGGSEIQGPGFDDYFAYMNSLSREYVFTRENAGEKEARNIKSESEALEKSIGFEKDSVTFYENMKKVVPKHDKDTVEALIAQEKEHLRRLTLMKGQL